MRLGPVSVLVLTAVTAVTRDQSVTIYTQGDITLELLTSNNGAIDLMGYQTS